MSWRDFYYLLEKYNGNMDEATDEELKYAVEGNPNEPYSARQLAQRKWDEEHKLKS